MSLFRGYGRLLQICQELIPRLFFFYHGWDRYNGFIIRTPQALCCLEGSTLSNLVHRRRRCARIVLHSILCLEGSTPQDRSGADTQTAPVGRCMCGIPYPGCRFALPWAKCLLPFQGAYLGRMMRGQGTLHQAKDIVVAPGEPFCTANGSYFVFWGLRRSCRQDWELRHWAAGKTRLEQRPMTEGPRRDAS